MRTHTLLAGATALSLLVSGCAGKNSDDMAGALLIGAAVVGLGVLAATASDDDDDDRRGYAYQSDGYGRRDERHRPRNEYRERSRDEYRYAGNGRCDDPNYRTSNGGHASPGSDERDCRRYGDGRK